MLDVLTPQFAVEQSGNGEVTVLATGDIDLLSKDAFNESLDRALEAADHKLVIDLSGVDFLDSTALNSLVRVHSTMRDGCELALRGAKANARRVLEVSGLAPFFVLE